MRLLSVHQPEPDLHRGDVVFVHGLDGDVRATWHPKNRDDLFWPSWLGSDLPEVGIWSLGYDSASTGWKGRASPLIDLGTSSLSTIYAHGVGERPLVFVAHSLGGLLVKQLLRNAVSYDDPRWQRIHDQTRGIVFLSTPHGGSDLANWSRFLGRLMRSTVSIGELEAHNPQLRDLNLWFRSHMRRTGIPLQVCFETQPTMGMMVVDATSADPGLPGVTPLPIAADHITISKPLERSSVLYLLVKRFVEESLQDREMIHEHQSDRHPVPRTAESSHPAVHTFLIADIRGYTRFTVTHGDEAAARLTETFATLAKDVAHAHGGSVIELRGDEALAVFDSARGALRAAIELQRRCGEEGEREPELSFRIGVGLDAGEAVPLEGGYRGASLNLAARLCSLAGPGEVLASDTVTNLARALNGVKYEERGQVHLKGFVDPVRVMIVEPLHSTVAGRQGEDAAPPASTEWGGGLGMRQDLPIGGYLGALPETILVYREDELQTLLECVSDAQQRKGRLVLLAGEPGAGKTRLAQEIALHGRNAGFLIAAGRCYESEQNVAYYPFVDALSTIYSLAQATIQQTAQRFTYLSALLPDQLPLQEASGGQDEQQRVFRAVVSFLEAVTEVRPVALLIDDLHWADSSSLGLLLHLARHTARLPILLLGTYRDVELGRHHPLERSLHQLHRESLARILDVARLPEEGTRALIATSIGDDEPVSDEFTHLVHSRTEGNPYFIHQVMRVLVERRDLFRKDGRWDRKEIEAIDMPASIRSAIGHRLSRLDAETQEVLAEASVLGQIFLFEDLLAMSGMEELAVETHLDAAREAGLILTEDGDTYRFDHALTQQALEQELSPRRRRRLHLVAGSAIENLPERRRRSRIGELAWHFLQGDNAEKAVLYSLQAGHEAAGVFANSEAEMHFRTAIELARDDGDTAHEAEGLEALARILRTSSHLVEAGDTASLAAEAYRGVGDDEGERRSVAVFGSIMSLLGRPDDGLSPIRELIARSASLTPGLVELHSAECSLLFNSFRLDELADRAHLCWDLAQQLGDERKLVWAGTDYGVSMQAIGDVRESLPLMYETAKRAESVGMLHDLAVNLHNAADGHRMLGELVQAEPLQRRSVEVAHRSGEVGFEGFGLAGLAVIMTHLGHWSQARQYAERSMHILEGLEHSWFTVYALLVLGWLDDLEGLPQADARLLQVLDMARAGSDFQAEFEVTPILAHRAMMQGEAGRALQLAQTFTETHDDVGRGFWVPVVAPYLAWARAELGDPESGLETICDALVTRALKDLALYRLPALRIQGLILTNLHQEVKGRRAFEEALDLARSMRYPFEEALALRGLGALELQLAHGEVAHEKFTEAVEILNRLGAIAYAKGTEELQTHVL